MPQGDLSAHGSMVSDLLNNVVSLGDPPMSRCAMRYDVEASESSSLLYLLVGNMNERAMNANKYMSLSCNVYS